VRANKKVNIMEIQGAHVAEIATFMPGENDGLAAARWSVPCPPVGVEDTQGSRCSVCGRTLAEEWEYLPCDVCGATVCSECISKADGHRMCPVCTSELEPWTELDSGITGVEADATWEDDLSEWGVEEIPATFT
tara:strand:+ start:436 stop:837 length:402 start_codon:yes stop_codon:yes gene_type:complete